MTQDGIAPARTAGGGLARAAGADPAQGVGAGPAQAASADPARAAGAAPTHAADAGPARRAAGDAARGGAIDHGAIDYGDRARLGLLVPSGNSVAEPEIHAMLPAGVAALVTRLELRGSSEPELRAMVGALEPAARLLADARPGLIAFHCTAVSTFAPEMAAGLRARIEAAAAIPACTTADGILAALAALGVRRLLLVTPYIAPVHAREVAWLAAHGITVAGGSHLGVDTNAEMARLPPAAIADQALTAAREAPSAEACFISCTAIRSAGLIAPLEAELGIPVLTSNQAMAWHALRRLGLEDAVPGFGRLFTP